MFAEACLMRVFWPSDAPRGDPGVIIGWRNSDLDFFVVDVLQGFEARRVDNAIRVGNLFRGSPHPLHQILERCGNSPPQVIGVTNSDPFPTSSNALTLSVYTTGSTRFPRVCCPQDSDLCVQVIVYDRPKSARMQFMSLNPILLALENTVDKGTNSSSTLSGIDAEEEKERQRKKALVEKLKLHTVMKYRVTKSELMLPLIINQINCSSELAALIQSNAGLVGVRAKRKLSVSEQVIESATNIWEYVLVEMRNLAIVYLFPIAYQCFIISLITCRYAAELLLIVLDWRLNPNSLALKDISATAQQMDVRLKQFCYWPVQYFKFRSRRKNWESITDNHPEYIRFFNSLWLVANDIIMGIAIGSYIINNKVFVAEQIDSLLKDWSIDGLRRMIEWLMSWPAGLKLNNELAVFLGDLFLWVIDYWADCMASLSPLLPHVIVFVGYCSFVGATLPIAMLSDILSILTLHIYAFYAASARTWNWQLSIIISLFHLFRGKKRNVLRNRIDSCDYDLDQLLLGTILFTLLFFLIPTVFVFYLTFASARVAIITFKAILDTALACLNHFPLFALMLRIKDSRRLPGGVCFDLKDTQSLNVYDLSNSTPTAYIMLQSVPLPLHLIFKEYFQLGNRIRKHYISPGNFLRFITGRFVPPIHRKNLYSLQYSMLPVRRAGARELWNLLKANEKPSPTRKHTFPNGHIKRTGVNSHLRRTYKAG